MKNVKEMLGPLLLWLVFVLAIALVAGAHPIADREAPLPTKGLDGHGLGYCVSLSEGGQQIGQVLVPFHRADPKKRDEFAISVYNAVTLIAQNAGRPDLASKAASLRIVRPGAAVDPESMTCACTNTTWSGDPRKGGRVMGCGGPCGSCASCTVTPQIK